MDGVRFGVSRLVFVLQFLKWIDLEGVAVDGVSLPIGAFRLNGGTYADFTVDCFE